MWMGGLFCAGIAGILAHGGMPLFPLDDLHFLGPVLDLHETGRLQNRFAQAQMREAGIELNLYYPPLFYYVLALWIKVFGLSTAALLSFCWTVLLGFGAALAGLGAKFGLPPSSVAWTAPMWLPMLAQSLRPDPLAYLLALLGLLAFRVDHAGWVAASVLVLGLSCFTYPVGAAIVVPFVVAELWSGHQRTPPTIQRVARLTIAALAGVTVCCLIVSWAVEGQFWALIQQLLRSRQDHLGPSSSYLGRTLAILTVGKLEWMNLSWLVAAVLAGGYALLSRSTSFSFPQRMGVMSFAAAACLAVLMYPLMGRCLAYVLGCVLAAVCCHQIRGAGWRRAALLCLIGWSVTTQLPAYAKALFSHPPSAEDTERIVKVIENSDKKVRVDASVARYCYNYRLPHHVTSLFFNTTDPAGKAVGFPSFLSSKPEEEIWIFSHTSARIVQMLGGFKDLDGRYTPPPPVQVFGKKLLSIPVQEKFVLIE